MYELWVWEQVSWRVLSVHPTRQQATQTPKHAGDPPGSWAVVKVGSAQSERIRANCTLRNAPRL
jgi:hypothetical protein